MKRWIAWAPLAVLVLLGVLFAVFALNRDPRYVPDAMVGKPLPALALPDLDGGPPTALRTAVQGPTFVNFFASWCVPCIQEAPNLNALEAAGARIVGIASRDDPADSEVFLNRYGNPFVKVLVDRDGRASVELGVSAYPETFLVGNDGMILAKHVGVLTMADAEAMLKTAQDAIR